MITPQDREKYRYHTDSSILGIKLVGGLTNKALLSSFKDLKRGVLGKVGELVRELMDLGDKKNSTNPNWIAGRILDEMYDREMLDNDEYDLVNKKWS